MVRAIEWEGVGGREKQPLKATQDVHTFLQTGALTEKTDPKN